jgi:hypothetical protein
MNINNHTIIVLALVIGLSLAYTASHAQDQDSRVENLKIAFITRKLDLSIEQAQQFWPVFNEFDVKRKSIRIDLRTLRDKEELVVAKDKQLNTVNKMIDLKEEELKLERAYVPKFAKVLKPWQVVQLYSIEREVAKHLLHRMEDRKEARKGGGRKGGHF